MGTEKLKEHLVAAREAACRATPPKNVKQRRLSNARSAETSISICLLNHLVYRATADNLTKTLVHAQYDGLKLAECCTESRLERQCL